MSSSEVSAEGCSCFHLSCRARALWRSRSRSLSCLPSHGPRALGKPPPDSAHQPRGLENGLRRQWGRRSLEPRPFPAPGPRSPLEELAPRCLEGCQPAGCSPTPDPAATWPGGPPGCRAPPPPTCPGRGWSSVGAAARKEPGVGQGRGRRVWRCPALAEPFSELTWEAFTNCGF